MRHAWEGAWGNSGATAGAQVGWVSTHSVGNGSELTGSKTEFLTGSKGNQSKVKSVITAAGLGFWAGKVVFHTTGLGGGGGKCARAVVKW